MSVYGIDDLDRAIADGEAHGLVKVLTRPGSDRILGATIVGEHAGEILAEFVAAMHHGFGLNKILGTIHIYPTLAEANKYAAGVWKRARVTRGQMALAERYNDWTRGAAGLAHALSGSCSSSPTSVPTPIPAQATATEVNHDRALPADSRHFRARPPGRSRSTTPTRPGTRC